MIEPNAKTAVESVNVRPSLITVIISLKNNVGGLRNTLASLVAQKERESVTVLVMDANSSDFPVDVVDTYSKQVAIDFVCGFDEGIYQSWNRALSYVKTPWLTFFGSGDTLAVGALARLVGYVSTDPAIDIVSSRSRNIFDNGKTRVDGRSFDPAEFARFFSINHSGVLYRRTLFDRYGNFDERYRSSGDYEFLMRVGSRLRFGYLDAVISEYLVGGISSSSTLPLKEAYAIRKKFGSVGVVDNLYLYWRGVLSMRFAKYFL